MQYIRGMVSVGSSLSKKKSSQVQTVILHNPHPRHGHGPSCYYRRREECRPRCVIEPVRCARSTYPKDKNTSRQIRPGTDVQGKHGKDQSGSDMSRVGSERALNSDTEGTFLRRKEDVRDGTQSHHEGTSWLSHRRACSRAGDRKIFLANNKNQKGNTAFTQG